MTSSRLVFSFLALATLAFSCSTKEKKVSGTKRIGFNVVSTFPHDTKSFTQGFVIHKGELYESTGQDKSWIGIVDIKSGIPDKKVVLDKEFFGEGITILNNKIYQLTWKNKKGFVYDVRTFAELRQFTYATEGWGITHDSANLIMSDGTDKLYFLDTTSLSVVRTLEVKDETGPLSDLNELEYVDGFIYANVWQTNFIAKIDATSGEVKGYLDLAALTQQARNLNSNIDVLNGIAWHPGTQSLLITGKLWPFIYIVKMKADPI